MNKKRVLSLCLAAGMTATSGLPTALADNQSVIYNTGTVISAEKMYNDGLIQKGTKNVQYDESSSKKGTFKVNENNQDNQTKAVSDIFGFEYSYNGVVDYAGSGKGKNTVQIPINVLSDDTYFAYVLSPSAKNISMWVDDENASTANGTSDAKSPSFTVEGADKSGYVYAFDCGSLTAGSHLLVFDGSSSDWCPDISAIAVTVSSAADFINPYQNEDLSFEERTADLISRMTLEEKCAQLGHNAPAIPRLGVSNYYYWREAAHGVVDQGQATSFPVSLSISNSWDPEMYYREADIVSTEARVKNNRYNLNYWAPTINMQRDPRWGRNNESFGEDPYLTTQFGSAFVKGMQGDEKYKKTIATLKHFLANNCEYERQTGSSEMDEQTLRDYYSKAFKNVVEEANPGAVMSSYNATTVTRNGEKLWDYIAQPANRNILTGLLRQNWGFDGFVTGDCGAVADLNGEAFKRALFPNAEKLSDVPQAATVAAAIKAGNELDCGNISVKYALEAIEKGYMSESDLDTALYRVFLERFRTGEFDDTEIYRNYTAEKDLETPENVAVALEAAEKGIVLLQNTKDADGKYILPLGNNIIEPTSEPTGTPEPAQTSEPTEKPITDWSIEIIGDSSVRITVPTNEKAGGNYKAIAAQYDGERLKKCLSVDFTAEENKSSYDIVFPEKINENTRIMIWSNNDGEDMKPMCAAKENDSLKADTASEDGSINIALVGGMASQTYIGDYSGTPTKNVSPYQGLKDRFGEGNVHFLGHADDNDTLFNIKAIKLLLKNGNEREVDLTKAENVSGMTAENGQLMNITPLGKATIPNVNFSDVTDVKIEMASGNSVGGMVYIGYSNESNIKSEISSKPTESLNDYEVCSAAYTGEDGGYNGTANMCITVQAKSDFMIDDGNGNSVINPKYNNALNDADVIIAYSGTMVGNGEAETGLNADGHESNDRTTISLPYRDRHVNAICNAKDSSGNNTYSDKTVVVMQTVGEVDVTPFKDNCRAILWTSYNGQRQGEALANILAGDVTPSGKLTSTWYAPSDLDIMTCGGVHTKDSEGITWKRNDYSIRQRYDENGNCTWPGRTYMYYNGIPQYPFGYGLSYTNFEYSDLKLDKDSVDANGELSASIKVKNTGNYAGTEIAQLYVHYENGDGINLPVQQLAGFTRVSLEPGEEKEVEIKADIKNLAQYSEKLEKYYMPTGKYDIWIGSNVTDKANIASFEMSGVLNSEIKTVSSIPDGVVVKGAYDAQENSTQAINEIKQEISAVMTDEEIYDLSKADVSFESEDESIARVSADGVVTAGTKEGVTIIRTIVTINGETKTAEIPVVCRLQKAINSDVRKEFVNSLDEIYAGYNENDYRDKYWSELTGIYTKAREELLNTQDEAKLQEILDTASEDMSKVRDSLKADEYAYTVILTGKNYRNADIEIIYNGDEDEPAADVIIDVYRNDELINSEKKECIAGVNENQKISIEDLEYGDIVKCRIEEAGALVSNETQAEIKKPSSHIVYDLSDSKYDRLAALTAGEAFEEIDGVGGYGDFNDISNVNYTYEYNGEKYNLTGGFQGGKGSFTKTNIYIRPFDCYSKATVTVLFDSSSADRKVRVSQEDGSKNGIILGEAGGAGNRNIVALTVETTDLTKPIYIMPLTKESIYTVIVDYED